MQTVHWEGGGRTRGIISNSDSDVLPRVPSLSPQAQNSRIIKLIFLITGERLGCTPVLRCQGSRAVF